MDEGKHEFYNKYTGIKPYRDCLIEICPTGCVKKGLDRKTGQLVAMKYIDSGKNEENPQDIVKNEISTVERQNHPRITCLLEKIVSNTKTFLIFEYLPHNLSTLIQTPGKAPNPSFRKYILGEILRGVEYLHSQNVVDIDLQTEKVLIDVDSRTVKLAYYGLPVRMPTVDDSSRWEFDMPKLWYRAPEFFMAAPEKWSSAVDMWSVGCIFAEMVTGKPLFPCDTLVDLYVHWSSLLRHPNGEFVANFVPDKDLTKDFVGLEPAGVDLLFKMLCMLPEKRITAKDALEHEYFKSD